MECLLISEDIIQRVRDSNDIVDIISEVVKLKRSGRNYVGLCPFHNEKTPSFSVVPEKQIYKCFGCGEGGNIFSFVMKTKKVNYVDAIKYLAEKVNIVVEEKDGLVKNANDKIYKINVEAARYFYSNLQNNKRAKDYLMNRKMSETIIRKFGVGYSLDSWKSLYNYMLRKNYTELDMLNAGLIIKNEKGAVYDRFRNRIIFPVFDSRGKVIGFGGRVLDESKPKYLNSPETSLFKKGINLYGLNFVLKRGDIPYLLMVEGYMDCISLHQFGVDTAVASLGTALTVNQAKLIKKYTN
ncbi:MAG TPA: DNA primase, partial [Clostridiaceae bacterium]